MSTLAATPGGWLEAVLGDGEIRTRLSEACQITDMLRVEAAYAQALGAVGAVDNGLAEDAAQAIREAEIDHAALMCAAGVDGVPVPELVRQLKTALPERLHEALHKGMTSQDVMDTAFILALHDITSILAARLTQLKAALMGLEARVGKNPLVGRTRMQAALPIGAAHRIGLWSRPLEHHAAQLDVVSKRVLQVQLGGPVGTRESLGPKAAEIGRHMAQKLGLGAAAQAWHTDRAGLAAYGSWAAGLTGHLGKIGHDIALMAQQGVGTVTLAAGGGSSAMAHKKNPIKAETLMTLARFSAVQLSALHLALEHEQERSGSAWALEWLSLPLLLEATGASLCRATRLIEEIDTMGDPWSDSKA